MAKLSLSSRRRVKLAMPLTCNNLFSSAIMTAGSPSTHIAIVVVQMVVMGRAIGAAKVPSLQCLFRMNKGAKGDEG